MPTRNDAHANGVRLHYVADGEGPLMLWLHGFPESWYAWPNQLAEFARDDRVLAPDMRGANFRHPLSHFLLDALYPLY